MALVEMARRIARTLFRKELPGKRLTPIEEIIYNEGERLIPGVTHDRKEFVRHRSSYEFFRRVIEADLAFAETRGGNVPLEIIDLGCGVGHGCRWLARIPGAHITGVDISPECIEYAQRYYSGPGVIYRRENLEKFIPLMPEYDYIVSRGVFEHIPGGLALAASGKCSRRLMFDVPYDEPQESNPHHCLTGIREEDFAGFPGAELFYQDLDGILYDRKTKPPKPNMILCIFSRPGLPEARRGISFPLPPWGGEEE
jgi:SAM-dependent methyltransferase